MMRWRLTVQRVCTASTGLIVIIISLQLVNLWSQRRSTTTTQSTQLAPSAVHQHQQPQTSEEIGDTDDTGHAAVPDYSDNMDNTGLAGGAGDDTEADKDAEADTSSHSDELPESLQSNESSAAETRRRRVEFECQRRGLSSKEWPRMPATMLVSDRFKAMYCMIGKVASSTWKKVFLMAAGKIAPSRADEFQYRRVGSRAVRVLQPMNGRHSERNRHRINTYFKFMFVRHPLDRLLSAFGDKFRLVPAYMRAYGRRIIRRYRANATTESLERGHDVTLEEFLRFVVDSGPRLRKDVHWTPQRELCRPCTISYDFIGRYEALWSDGDYVLRRLGIDSDVKFPRWTKNRTDTEHYDSVFARVRPDYVKRLKQLYSQDYDFFGYT